MPIVGRDTVVNVALNPHLSGPIDTTPEDAMTIGTDQAAVRRILHAASDFGMARRYRSRPVVIDPSPVAAPGQ
jgi:hypothetical protein